MCLRTVGARFNGCAVPSICHIDLAIDNDLCGIPPVNVVYALGDDGPSQKFSFEQKADCNLMM
jgi:hypothetical protein